MNDKYRRNGGIPRGNRERRRNSQDTTVEGVISMSRGGSGFVPAPELGMDIMISKHDMDLALPGDRVLVSVNPPLKGETRRSGRIIRVVERGARDIVGTLQSSGHFFVVIPLSPTYKTSFYVPDAKGANIGDRVVIRFSDWSNKMFNPEAEIIDIIGPSDKPSLDTESIIRNFDLPRDFPPEVISEAEQVSRLLKSGGNRTDLRDKYIITIDPVTARDFDDAISLELDDQGRRVLGVHIADVSHFVRPGSALDREALRRGTSVYLVDKVIPMLPEQLSNGVCSLRPDEDRLTVSVFMTFSESGRMEKREFCRSKIRSKLRLAYEEAMSVIDGKAPESGKQIPDEALNLIRDVNKLSQQLRAARFRRFALDLTVPEMQVVIDPNGCMTGLVAAEHDISHELIEECMVAANEAVATEMANAKIPFISRFHDFPDAEKLEELSGNLAAMNIYPGDLSDPRNLAKVIKSLDGNPLRYYADMLILRSMKRAEYNADEKGHFGLGKKFYSHFTSPIRRYPDLIMHRQLCTLIGADKSSKQPSIQQLRSFAAKSTEQEYNAEQASRDLIEIKKYRFLEEQLDKGETVEYDAVIVKIMNFGVFVEVVDLQVSGMVHVSALSKHFMRYNDVRQTLSAPDGTFRIGEKIRVFVTGVDFDNRKIDFGIVRGDESHRVRSTGDRTQRRSDDNKSGSHNRETALERKPADKDRKRHGSRSSDSRSRYGEKNKGNGEHHRSQRKFNGKSGKRR